jgi:hypothetical protein
MQFYLKRQRCHSACEASVYVVVWAEGQAQAILNLGAKKRDWLILRHLTLYGLRLPSLRLVKRVISLNHLEQLDFTKTSSCKRSETIAIC